MLVVAIALPIPNNQLFDYLWPESTHKPQIGMAVLVPFGSRKLIGVIYQINSASKYKNLKTILAQPQHSTLISQPMLKLLSWASAYYQHPLGLTLKQALPPNLKQTQPITYDLPNWLKLANTTKPKGLSAAGNKLWELLISIPNGCHITNFYHYNIQLRTINTAIKQQWLIAAPPTNATQPCNLNAAQSNIFKQIITNNKFQVHYIEGTTGSGKTYIYAKIMQHHIKNQQQCLLLVPEISLTHHIINKLQQLCGSQFTCLHSKLSTQQKTLAWQQVQKSWAKWIVGTRSALFLPWQKLGCIIIDEAHDNSFKQQSSWRYSARDCAIMYAKILNIPIVLGSATPALESLYNINNNRYQHYQLTSRFAQATKPTTKLIDMRNCKDPIHPQTLTAINTTLKQQQQVLIFINRRGFAPVMYCKACQWTSDCDQCSSKMVFHKTNSCLLCHHCNATCKLPSYCPKCQQAIIPLGYGSQRIEDWLTTNTSANIIRIDKDSTSKTGALEQALAAIKAEKYNLIVGTQMLAKGHHWPKLTLVVILDADNDLYSPDFRAMEKFAQLFTQVAGRAGRDKLPGQVYIQTAWPEHPQFKLLLTKGYRHFALQLLIERQQAQLPPVTKLAYIIISGQSVTQVTSVSQKLLHDSYDIAKNHSIKLIGPIPAWLAQLAGKHRCQVTCIASNSHHLQSFLTKLAPIINQLSHNKLKFTIDVDPLVLP